MESNTPKKSLILYNIRSNENVGSLLRTADAVGIEKVYLVGYTPCPIDRFGREVGAIAKTALGAQKTVPWEKVEAIDIVLKVLKGEGVTIVAIEQAPSAIDYKDVPSAPCMACMLGNEVEGIEPEVLRQVDIIAEIPMRGQKESLNVSVATGVALFALLN